MANGNPTGKAFSLIVLVAVAVIGVFAWQVLPDFFQTDAAPEPVAAPPAPTIEPDDPTLGDAASGKTIIAFGDYQCPGCASIQPFLDELAEQGSARIVWKDCPIGTHPEAQAAAEAARCAGDQNRFWDYHRLLMQDQDRLGNDLYLELARELKLDEPRFTRCLDERHKTARVQLSLRECLSSGVPETPALWLDGKFYSSTESAALMNRLNRP
jgi:protein-disulfide isomerase